MNFLPPSNEIIEVGTLTRRIKTILEQSFSEIWIRGEVSNLRKQSSGHVYFSLKDESSQIRSVCFKRDAQQLDFDLRDGTQVIGFGRLSVYEPHGTYQVIFSHIVEDGIGNLQQRFEQLKTKLLAEGLFDKALKKPIPSLPKKVVIITSPTGAALRDFISILKRRHWHGSLLVIPVRVQGNEAAAEICKGISLANEKKLGDLIVISRGGGSIEDLWSFNEETVARAVASSTIPTISAVGHEIDFVLSDFVADFRAETPSAAAELISSSYLKLIEKKDRLTNSFNEIISFELNQHQQSIRLMKSRIQQFHPKRQIENAYLRLDDFSSRLTQTTQASIHQSSNRFKDLKSRFDKTHPKERLKFLREKINQIEIRLKNSSHEATLKRGYAIIRNEENTIISSTKSLAPNQNIKIQLRDGEETAEVN